MTGRKKEERYPNVTRDGAKVEAQLLTRRIDTGEGGIDFKSEDGSGKIKRKSLRITLKEE